MTSKWIAAADAPFEEIDKGLTAVLVFTKFEDTGVWSAKAKRAYREWSTDCQNPVKLYRATRFYGIASEVDRDFSGDKEAKRMGGHLNEGWDIVKNPPQSYLFVRAGYRFNAGDGDNHNFGDLAVQLLKRNPADRGVSIGAMEEMWIERLLGKGGNSNSTSVRFETLVIESMLKARKSAMWRPWDDVFLGKAYLCKALRTRKLEDMNKAIFYNEEAIRKAPKGYNVDYLLKNRAILVARRKQFG